MKIETAEHAADAAAQLLRVTAEIAEIEARHDEAVAEAHRAHKARLADMAAEVGARGPYADGLRAALAEYILRGGTDPGTRGVTFMRSFVARVDQPRDVPAEYLVPDMAALTAAAKQAGTSLCIPGVTAVPRVTVRVSGGSR